MRPDVPGILPQNIRRCMSSSAKENPPRRTLHLMRVRNPRLHREDSKNQLKAVAKIRSELCDDFLLPV